MIIFLFLKSNQSYSLFFPSLFISLLNFLLSHQPIVILSTFVSNANKNFRAKILLILSYSYQSKLTTLEINCQ